MTAAGWLPPVLPAGGLSAGRGVLGWQDRGPVGGRAGGGAWRASRPAG